MTWRYYMIEGVELYAPNADWAFAQARARFPHLTTWRCSGSRP